jgi:hypothetical protein
MWEDRAKLGETLSRVNFLTSNEKRGILGFEPDDRIPQVMLSSGTAVSEDGQTVEDVPATPAAPPTTPQAAPNKMTPLRAIQ